MTAQLSGPEMAGSDHPRPRGAFSFKAACATERTSGFGTGKYPGFSGSEVVNLDHVGCTVVYCYLLLLVRPKSLRSPMFGPMPYLVTPHNNTSGAEKQSFCVFFCSFDMI